LLWEKVTNKNGFRNKIGPKELAAFFEKRLCASFPLEKNLVPKKKRRNYPISPVPFQGGQPLG